VGSSCFGRGLGCLLGGGAVALVALLWLLGAVAPQKAFNEAVHGKAPAPRQQPGKKAPAPQAAAPQKEAPSSPLIPAGVLLVSACCASVPFVRGYSARRTCYALTNRRALVCMLGRFGPTRESYTSLEVSGMRRSNSWISRGSGDLIFRTVHVVKRARVSPGVSQSSVKTLHYGFLAVPQVHEVEKVV